MAARRCSDCDIDYPYDKKVCPACDKELWEVTGEAAKADPDWQTRSRRRRAIIEGGATPDIDQELIRYKDRLWIAEKILMEWGYTPMGLSIVQVRGEFYELVGRITGEETGWWLDPVSTEYDLEHPVMTPTEYLRLEMARGLRQ